MPAIKTKAPPARTLVLVNTYRCQFCGEHLIDSPRRGEMLCPDCGQEYAMVPESWVRR